MLPVRYGHPRGGSMEVVSGGMVIPRGSMGVAKGSISSIAGALEAWLCDIMYRIGCQYANLMKSNCARGLPEAPLSRRVSRLPSGL